MESLQSELSQYELQLSQVQVAISASADGPDKDNLISLEKEIYELIKLTKDSMQDCVAQNEPNSDPFEDEYKLFQAELGVLNSEKDDLKVDPNDIVSKSSDLKSDLQGIEGMKCQAPYKYAWTEDFTYHNALIFCLENLNSITEPDDIKVRVMFTNPTHKEMLPCPYYLDGECKFDDEKCRYSHGEIVYFNSLKDYREPEFSKLTEGKAVLAKKDDGLWHRAIIKSIDGVKCLVKFESNLEDEILLQNILPLDGPEEFIQECEDSNSDNDIGIHDNETIKRILMAPPSSALGEWEKFTKGFGSRMMAKMGYIHGSGLGRDGNGRVEPVPAVIFPAGKSLDHCMMLKENSGSGEEFFRAERRMKRLQKKHEKMLQKSYEREKERTDVFMFLNKNLGQTNSTTNVEENTQKHLKNKSTRSLNVTGLQLAEEAKKMEKEIRSLKNALSRHSIQSKEFKILKEKITDCEGKLSQLHASEQRIATEQELRRDRKKLTVF